MTAHHRQSPVDMAADLDLVREFRIPLPDSDVGGYAEIAVLREATGSDRWAITDGAVSGLRAWVDGRWQRVADIGREAAFHFDLDGAFAVVEDVAHLARQDLDAHVRAVAKLRRTLAPEGGAAGD
ncbi:hypothetical protein [Streptomyces chumphonensis]|uniref:hypothetical protein n=1 Tax=Streptomyces chumphonensis TaxID=1214925 RepID=UPI003D7170A1